MQTPRKNIHPEQNTAPKKKKKKKKAKQSTSVLATVPKQTTGVQPLPIEEKKETKQQLETAIEQYEQAMAYFRDYHMVEAGEILNKNISILRNLFQQYPEEAIAKALYANCFLHAKIFKEGDGKITVAIKLLTEAIQVAKDFPSIDIADAYFHRGLAYQTQSQHLPAMQVMLQEKTLLKLANEDMVQAHLLAKDEYTQIASEFFRGCSDEYSMIMILKKVEEIIEKSKQSTAPIQKFNSVAKQCYLLARLYIANSKNKQEDVVFLSLAAVLIKKCIELSISNRISINEEFISYHITLIELASELGDHKKVIELCQETLILSSGKSFNNQFNYILNYYLAVSSYHLHDFSKVNLYCAEAIRFEQTPAPSHMAELLLCIKSEVENRDKKTEETSPDTGETVENLWATAVAYYNSLAKEIKPDEKIAALKKSIGLFMQLRKNYFNTEYLSKSSIYLVNLYTRLGRAYGSDQQTTDAKLTKAQQCFTLAIEHGRRYLTQVDLTETYLERSRIYHKKSKMNTMALSRTYYHCAYMDLTYATQVTQQKNLKVIAYLCFAEFYGAMPSNVDPVLQMLDGAIKVLEAPDETKDGPQKIGWATDKTLAEEIELSIDFLINDFLKKLMEDQSGVFDDSRKKVLFMEVYNRCCLLIKSSTLQDKDKHKHLMALDERRVQNEEFFKKRLTETPPLAETKEKQTSSQSESAPVLPGSIVPELLRSLEKLEEAYCKNKDVETGVELFNLKIRLALMYPIDISHLKYFAEAITIGSSHSEHIDLSCIYRERGRVCLQIAKLVDFSAQFNLNMAVSCTQHKYTKALAYLYFAEFLASDLKEFKQTTSKIDQAIALLKEPDELYTIKKAGWANGSDVSIQIGQLLDYFTAPWHDLIQNSKQYDALHKKTMLFEIDEKFHQLVEISEHKDGNERLVDFYQHQAKLLLSLDKAQFVNETKTICEKALKLFASDETCIQKKPIAYYWINYYYADVLYRRGDYANSVIYAKIAVSQEKNTNSTKAKILLFAAQKKLTATQPPQPLSEIDEKELFNNALQYYNDALHQKNKLEQNKLYQKAIDILQRLKQTSETSKEIQLLYICYKMLAYNLMGGDDEPTTDLNKAHQLYSEVIKIGKTCPTEFDLTDSYIKRSEIFFRWALTSEAKESITSNFAHAEIDLDSALKQTRYQTNKIFIHLAQARIYCIQPDQVDRGLEAFDLAIMLLKAPEEKITDGMSGYVTLDEITLEIQQLIYVFISLIASIEDTVELEHQKRIEIIKKMSDKIIQVIELLKIPDPTSLLVKTHAAEARALTKLKEPDFKKAYATCIKGLEYFQSSPQLIQQNPDEYYLLNYHCAEALFQKGDFTNSKKHCEEVLRFSHLCKGLNNQASHLLDQIHLVLLQKIKDRLSTLSGPDEKLLEVEQGLIFIAKIKKSTCMGPIVKDFKQKFIELTLPKVRAMKAEFKKVSSLIGQYTRLSNQLDQLSFEFAKKSFAEIESAALLLQSQMTLLLDEIAKTFQGPDAQLVQLLKNIKSFQIQLQGPFQQHIKQGETSKETMSQFLQNKSSATIATDVTSLIEKAKRAYEKQARKAVADLAKQKKQAEESAAKQKMLEEEKKSEVLEAPKKEHYKKTRRKKRTATNRRKRPELPKPSEKPKLSSALKINKPKKIQIVDEKRPASPIVSVEHSSAAVLATNQSPVLTESPVSLSITEGAMPTLPLSPLSSSTSPALEGGPQAEGASQSSAMLLLSPTDTVSQSEPSLSSQASLSEDTPLSISPSSEAALSPFPKDTSTTKSAPILAKKNALQAQSIGLSVALFDTILRINNKLAKEERLAPYHLELCIYGTKVLNYLLIKHHDVVISSKDTDLFIENAPTEDPLPAFNAYESTYIAWQQTLIKNQQTTNAYHDLVSIIQEEKFKKSNQKQKEFFENFASEDKLTEIAICNKHYYTYDPFHFTRGVISIGLDGVPKPHFSPELEEEIRNKIFELDLPQPGDPFVKNFFTRLIKYYEKLSPLLPEFQFGPCFKAAIGEGEGDLMNWQRDYILDMLEIKTSDLSNSPIHLEMMSIIRNGQFVRGSLGERIIGEFCQALAEKYYNVQLNETALQGLLANLQKKYITQPTSAASFDADLRSLISSMIPEEEEERGELQSPSTELFPPEAPLPAYVVEDKSYHHYHYHYLMLQHQPQLMAPLLLGSVPVPAFIPTAEHQLPSSSPQQFFSGWMQGEGPASGPLPAYNPQKPQPRWSPRTFKSLETPQGPASAPVHPKQYGNGRPV